MFRSVLSSVSRILASPVRVRCYNITPTVRPKRFYKNVDVKREEDGYFIQLDGRDLRTPAKAKMLLPNEKFAYAVAVEWDAQLSHVKPYLMPMTQVAATVIDRMSTARSAAIAEILQYLDSDTLCYVLDDIDDLRALQQKRQQPIVSWFERRMNFPLARAHGFDMPQHVPGLRDAFAQHLETLDNWRLVAFHTATAAGKSAVIAMAQSEFQVSPEEAVAAARVEEDFQVSRFGHMEGAHDIDSANAVLNAATASTVFRFLDEKK